jgi:hypothetical protein
MSNQVDKPKPPEKPKPKPKPIGIIMETFGDKSTYDKKGKKRS